MPLYFPVWMGSFITIGHYISKQIWQLMSVLNNLIGGANTNNIENICITLTLNYPKAICIKWGLLLFYGLELRNQVFFAIDAQN